MKKMFSQMINSSLLNCSKRLAIVVVFLSCAAMASAGSYKATAKSSDSAKGKVYVVIDNNMTIESVTEWGDEKSAEKSCSSWGCTPQGTVYLYANAEPGYYFTEWKGTTTGNNNPHSYGFKVTADNAITTANFNSILDLSQVGNEGIVLYKKADGTVTSKSISVTVDKSRALQITNPAPDVFSITDDASTKLDGGSNLVTITIGQNTVDLGEATVGERQYSITLTPSNADLNQYVYEPKSETIDISIRELPTITFLPANGCTYSFSQAQIPGGTTPTTITNQRVEISILPEHNGNDAYFTMSVTKDANTRFRRWVITEGETVRYDYNENTILHIQKSATVKPEVLSAEYAQFIILPDTVTKYAHLEDALAVAKSLNDENRKVISVYVPNKISLNITTSKDSEGKVTYRLSTMTLQGKNSWILPKPESDTYTIPAGYTLLIPGTSKTQLDNAVKDGTTPKVLNGTDYYNLMDKPSSDDYFEGTTPTPVCVCKLTVESGTTIKVDGNISVYSCTATGQGYTGRPTGYGQIHLQDGSYIQLNSGSNLFAMGYISGNPNASSVNAANGANVYETFQFTDWRGGSAMMGGGASEVLGAILSGALSSGKIGLVKNDYHVFPFGQYYVQNIETMLNLEYGAVASVSVAVDLLSAVVLTMPYISTFDDENALFRFNENVEFRKYYDGVNDRQIYQVDGTSDAKATIGRIFMEVGVMGTTLPINSEDYVLPISNNIDIIVNNVSLDCPSDIALMAGSKLTISHGSELVIKKKLILYDAELNVRPDFTTPTLDANGKPTNSGGYYGSSSQPLIPITYTAYHGKAPGKRKVSTVRYPVKSNAADTTLLLTDASIILDGTMTMVENGALYTTTDTTYIAGINGSTKEKDFGANITSNGGGIMNYFAIGTEKTTNQIDQTGTTTSPITNIPICNAWLRNTDGSRTGGKGAKQGDTYMYFKNGNEGKWLKPDAGITNWRQDTFAITLPKDLTQNVICDVVEEGVTITWNSIVVTGDGFEKAGDFVYDSNAKTLTIPVKYKHTGIHETAKEGKITIEFEFEDPLTHEAVARTVDVPLVATEDYEPKFQLAINGTNYLDGSQYPPLTGTGVGEPIVLTVEITADTNNVANSYADWIDTCDNPFSFNFGTKSDQPYQNATLTYYPTTADIHEGCLIVTAEYTDSTPRTLTKSVKVCLKAQTDLKDNTLDFADFPRTVYDDEDLTPAFPLLNPETDNAKTPIEKSDITLSISGLVEILGSGTDADPYMVKPIAPGTVDITVTQGASASVESTTIKTTITVTSTSTLLSRVPFCVNTLNLFNIHTMNGSKSVRFNNGVEFNSSETVAEWMFRFLGTPDKLILQPNGTDAWYIQERADENEDWKNVALDKVWTGEEVTLQLSPTTNQVRIRYNNTKKDVGVLSKVCVTDLRVSSNVDKLYLPIYVNKDELMDVIFTHTTATPSISLSGLDYTTTSATGNLGTDDAPYYRTTVTVKSTPSTAEGTYTLQATEGGNTAVVQVIAYNFPQDLPIKLADDTDDEIFHYVSVKKDEAYVEWDANKRQVVFTNPGSQLTRSVTFAFNGAPSIIRFDLSSANGDESVVDSEWIIKESVDGVDYSVATLARDSEDGKTLQQELKFTTRFVRIEYNSVRLQEMRLSNLVIEGYPGVVLVPNELTFSPEYAQQNLGVITINLSNVNFEIDNTTAFQISTDTTSAATNWQSVITATEGTHSTALGVNKVDTIFLGVKWLRQTALDRGTITIRNNVDNSVLATAKLVGTDGYIIKENADNTGLYTGIPTKYTYHGKAYDGYEHHKVNLTNAFAKDGTALFDYLFIYGETTPAEGTDITSPGKEGTLTGSNAVTPYYVYKKTQGIAYMRVAEIENANVSHKDTAGNLIINDTVDVKYIDVENNNLSIYMTGFCPYATTGFTKNQEGVFLFRGKHASKLDIYLEDFHVFSRNKTENGNYFYGDKEGGDVSTDGYARGSGGVLVFENTDKQQLLQNYEPFEVTIHTTGNNLLVSNYGNFYGVAIQNQVAMKAYQVSSPVHIHMHTKDHAKMTRTTLNFTDEWPTEVNASGEVTKTKRTNGYLGLKKQANNAPSIDMGNKHTTVNFKGGRVELQNSQIGSDTYKTTLAISHRSGYFGSEGGGVQLCYGIGTDSVGGEVNFLDGTVTVEPMEVKAAYRQYYLMDVRLTASGDTVRDSAGKIVYSDSTSCLRLPKNTYVYGGSHCFMRACQHVTSKGGAPKDGENGSLLGQYVYDLNAQGGNINATGLATNLQFPSCVDNLANYLSLRTYTYGLESVAPDSNKKLYFWIPDGYGGVSAEQDKLTSTWKACMTEITAGIQSVAEGSIGGDTPIEQNEEVKYFLYCKIDDDIKNVIRAGEKNPVTGEVLDYTYQPPFEVPSAAKTFFKNKKYARFDLLRHVGDALQHQVVSDTSYTITDRVYYMTTATADIWQTFTAPFDVANIYVMETYSENALEQMGDTAQNPRAAILKAQAEHNADFAAFFAVAMAMGTYNDFDSICNSYLTWAKIQDRDSLRLWDGAGDYTLRSKQRLIPYVGKNWREANFYLNENKGNWGLTQYADSFAVQWSMLPDTAMQDGILLHKGKTYSLMFPYCPACEASLANRKYWDYWSGKFIIFESTAGAQVINGRDFLNDTIAGNVFTQKPNANEVVVTGNSTFAQLQPTQENIYIYNSDAPRLNSEIFEPVDLRKGIIIQPTTAFLYGNVPTRNGMPAKAISRSGQIIYDKENTPTGNQGGHIPTVGGGNDLFITATVAGVNIAVAEPQQVRVMSATGAIIFSGMVQTAVDVALPTTGVYVITGENEVHKILH